MNTNDQLPVAIIGAGPVGLAAAAHLTTRSIPFILFEAEHTVGGNILSWEHIRVFSPWKFNLDKAAVSLLKETDWTAPNEDELPTGKELIESYLKPFSILAEIKPFIHLNSKVKAVGRENLDKMKTWGREEKLFVLQVEHSGKETEFYKARAVLDTSGTWKNPNPIGSGGTYAHGELENSSHITYGIPDVSGKDKTRFTNKSVLVVGSGHSAINVLLELAQLKDEFPETKISWVLRKERLEDVYGGQEKDAFAARGALGIKIEQLVIEEKIDVYTPFHIEELHPVNGSLLVVGRKNGERRALSGIDEIISNTGSRPDFSILSEIRLNVDPAIESAADIAELIDPNIHSCSSSWRKRIKASGKRLLYRRR